MTKPELPEDLVEEILCRVPATSLKRLRSTCKRWNRLFNDDGRFARKHLDKATKQFMVLMLTNQYSIGPVSIDLSRTIPSVEVKAEYSLIDPQPEYSAKLDIERVIHCDGVLLCTFWSNMSRIVVWNPLTGEQRWIRTGYRSQSGRAFNIGYCQGDNKSCNKSYRVLSCYCDIHNFEMYEFNSDTWRSLGDICPGWRLRPHVSVSLKGSTYTFAEDETKTPPNLSLLKIDYSTEKSVPVPLPCDQGIEYEESTLSVVREEKLALLSQRDEKSKTEIWVTNKIDETTKAVSWSKVLAFDMSPDLRISDFGSFLLDEEKKVLVYCDTLFEDDDYHRDIIYIVREDNNKVIEEEFVADKVDLCSQTILNYVPSLDKIKQAKAQGKRKRGDD
ncbi:PREDICTED: F-box protein ETP2-like [Camelina sativa]|uniref:F-box protein ETP2-like n=1 Tax=Camelina sativa TaxID=90675 RepID=A0ABM0WAW3_CAMSA|nr:PREDICTED: F-box protein ETP2-like [Camelina sativa]